jgi:transposase
MSNVTTIGIDLAKNSFSVHGVDAGGAVVLRKTVSRARLMGLLMEQPPSLIGLEACSGGHEWAR